LKIQMSVKVPHGVVCADAAHPHPHPHCRQLHFHDPRNKPVDVIHLLKLDRTFSGRQVLGSETVTQIELDRLTVADSEGTARCPAVHAAGFLSLRRFGLG
jgi:hypothetical protein